MFLTDRVMQSALTAIFTTSRIHFSVVFLAEICWFAVVILLVRFKADKTQLLGLQELPHLNITLALDLAPQLGTSECLVIL